MIDIIMVVLLGMVAITLKVLAAIMIKDFLIPDIKYNRKRNKERKEKEAKRKARREEDRKIFAKELEELKKSGIKNYYGFIER